MRSSQRREQGQIGKTQNLSSMTRSARVIPLQNAFYEGECWRHCCEIESAKGTGSDRKVAKAVIHGAGRFPLLTLFPAR
ncbi:hypothetical protein ACVWYV_003628 [Pantoea eucalypti]